MERSLRLNRAVHLLEPTQNTKSQDEPDVILLVGWMQASTRHLAKYTSAYEKLYPSARILAVETVAADFFHSQSADLKRIAPVLEILYGLPSDAKLLLHFFSNGGAWTTANIARAYQKRTGRPLPATALILGKPKYSLRSSKERIECRLLAPHTSYYCFGLSGSTKLTILIKTAHPGNQPTEQQSVLSQSVCQKMPSFASLPSVFFTSIWPCINSSYGYCVLPT